MSYADELYKYYTEAKEVSEEPEVVKVPASAKLIYTYYDPRSTGGATIMVRATKARWFVWRFGVWAVKTESEARAVIAWAEADKERRLAEIARIWKVRDYVDRLRSVRIKKKAKADRDALLASIEEAALRMTIKAATLTERMAINDEKERLEQEVYEAYSNLDLDDDGIDLTGYETPELPESWRIIAANPSKNQYNFEKYL
jgi:hypothetical protein